MSKVCPVCAFDNPDIMRYCGQCGIRLPVLTESAVSDVSALNQFEGMIGANLQERFRAAGLQAAGQKRHISVLFVDLTGFTHLSQGIDAETLYEIVQNCSRIFANSVYKFDGMVDKFTGDGIMALFGAPIAHENNAELAIRAALDIAEELRMYSETVKDEIGQDLTAHIGLNSGLVIVGGIGSNLMMNYTAIGDVVNLASRIMNVATGGQILISERMYKQVRSILDCQAEKPVRVKGVDKPIQPYLVRGVKERLILSSLDSMYSPLVGRSLELVTLNNDLRATEKDGLTRVDLLVGEAGIGKSRLVQEWLSHHEHEDRNVLIGTAAPYTRSATYSLIIKLIHQKVGITSRTPVKDQQALLAEVARSINSEPELMIAHLERLLGLPATYPETNNSFSYLQPEQLQQQLFRSVRDVLAGDLKKLRTIMVLADLQWIDAGSLSFIRYFLDQFQKSSFFVLITARDLSDPQLKELTPAIETTYASRYNIIELKPLDGDSTRHLFNNLVPGNDLPDSVVNALIERSGGIPLYLEEMIRSLIDDEAIRKNESGWSATKTIDIESLSNTDTLEGLILTRFDKLDSASREILKFASVIGRSFNRDLLSGSLPIELGNGLDRALYTILEKEFIQVDREGDADLVFPNVTVQDVIYGSILKKDKRSMHALVGGGIESLYPTNLNQFTDSLAYHFSKSDRYNKGLHYLLLAANKASLNFNNMQALQNFEQAISLLSKTEATIEQIYSAYFGAGNSMVFLGKYKKARNSFKKLQDILGGEEADTVKFVSPAQRASINRKVAETFDKQGDFESAIENLHSAQSFADQAADQERANELVQIFNDLAWIDFRRGRFDEAEKMYKKALHLTDISTRPDVIASVYNRLGGLYYERNELKDALSYSENALNIRKMVNDQQGLAKSLNNLAILNWKLGAGEEAKKDFESCLELESKLGDVETSIIVRANYGMLLAEYGDPDSAVGTIQQAMLEAEEIEHPSLIAVTNLFIGKVFIDDSKYEKAETFTVKAVSIFQGLDDPEYNTDSRLDHCKILIGLNKITQAEKEFGKAKKLFAKLDEDIQGTNAGKIELIEALINQAKNQIDLADEFFRRSADCYFEVNEEWEYGKVIVAYLEFLQRINKQERFESLIKEANAKISKQNVWDYISVHASKLRQTSPTT